MLGSRVLMLLLPLMLPPLTWLAETRAVPEGSRPAWVRGQQLSQQLCTLAWGTHPPMGHVDLPREEEDDETTQEVPRIQCGDGCDPQGLEDNSQFCLQRIHQGLVFYEKLLGSDIFTGEPSPLPDGPVGQLHASLLGLRQLLQPEGHHWETEQTPSPSPSQPWQRLLLRFKILRSLQAFVAVAARVFAHGAATLSP
ncbi:interleukin-23 subunit alpha isoform X3 [Mustela erminea]|uniref:interleukin-23 subunit alpha isoform X3 n=1 Tax=Mustela erminea TaxID=36723 RepID=UPI0013869044|nr:interleukin-23 subunit alpha isoform X3 [Mustela erminea]XP_032204529.1 interleukin-23 subunit alpha isoform X3 [Mustela erminea]XP_032204530.1 interleukin-23 subunit alpha isoform X3 [Mustela erminea]XP_032204531.1 interleukin-23 subunit alpha isoform X3 [Mustela erminea]XP_032204532.1 interleukin-23 subunit alpha isoform X3 [Mustela erminea]XP_032204534.1 interleukin-23 subunit alpha isoform X3 [Mustela erminea]XP_032204535.1 interleukin-23 subunit alpha isoform X3 [Mustela erminea]XP_0